MPAVLAKAYEILTTCPCTAGCPGCVYDSKCTNHNSVVDKAGAALLARRLGELIGKSAGEDTPGYEPNAPATSAPFAGPVDEVSCSSSAATRIRSTETLLEASPRRAQRIRMAAAEGRNTLRQATHLYQSEAATRTHMYNDTSNKAQDAVAHSLEHNL